jgi:hypothetical protein
VIRTVPIACKVRKCDHVLTVCHSTRINYLLISTTTDFIVLGINYCFVLFVQNTVHYRAIRSRNELAQAVAYLSFVWENAVSSLDRDTDFSESLVGFSQSLQVDTGSVLQ